jgi:UTP-glucose-1-phosphate uridylyltransferase
VAIRNAVIPVAGMGTRLFRLPIAPKEMLPVGKKPIVQYVVEELKQRASNGFFRYRTRQELDRRSPTTIAIS